MDIYQIFTTHNRMWSPREIICFSVIAFFVFLILLRKVFQKDITKSQAVASMVLLLFLGIVYGSTVFTRSVGTRQYELIPFWSWREVIVHHDWSLLQEDFLNCLLLVPMGMLLPFVSNRRVHPGWAFLAGFLVSFCIEVSQLIFLRGLFEWDDMIHNSFGCMMGCIVCNLLIRSYHSLKKGQNS